jgi:hypothetical protein
MDKKAAINAFMHSVVAIIIVALFSFQTPAATPRPVAQLHLSTSGFNALPLRKVQPSASKDSSRTVRLKINRPMSAETYPERHEQSYFVGSTMVLNIDIELSDRSRVSELVRDTSAQWPQGLVITAGIIDNKGKFVPLEGLTSQLNAQHCQAVGKGEYRFLFTVPSSPLVHSSFRLKVTYDHPTLGRIEAKTYPLIDVIEPKNSDDWNIVWDSIVRQSTYRLDQTCIVQLADSLVNLGYCAQYGLHDAQTAAENLKLWDKAVKFFDTNYKTNGEAALIFKTDNMTKAEQLEEYQRVRQRLLNGAPETRTPPKPILQY